MCELFFCRLNYIRILRLQIIIISLHNDYNKDDKNLLRWRGLMERELDYKAIGKRVKIARIKADMK